MKDFMKAKITNTGSQYTDIIGEAIRLISAKQFDAVYVFYYDVFECKLYIQRFDHVNKCTGTPLNSRVVKKDGWDAIAERNGDMYANTTIDNRISLQTVLTQALVDNKEFATHDFIYQASQLVSRSRIGWKILFRSNDNYTRVIRDYLWEQVEQYIITEHDDSQEDIDSYYEWHTDQGDMRIVHQYTICNHRDHNRSVIIYKDGKYICTKCNNDITKAVNNILYDTKDTNILNKKNKLYQLGFDNFNMPDLFDHEHMVPVSKLPSYIDDFPGQQTINSIMESTTIDPVKKVEMLHDELGLSYDQIRRIVLEKTSKS